MKNKICLFVLILLTVNSAMSLEAQNKTWPPKRFPTNVPFKVLNSIYYWKIKSITCIGKSNRGYKFRIKGICSHDASNLSMAQSVNIAVEEKGNKIKSAGAYFFPRVKQGELFSFDIVSAFQGMYSPSNFVGLLVYSDFPIEEKEEVLIPPPNLTSEVEQIVLVDTDNVEEQEQEKQNEDLSQDEITTDVLEKLPEYPGGRTALALFLSQNIIYPPKAIDEGIEGRVIVKFVIDKDGNIVNPIITQSVDESLDKEALRIIKKMPKWNPGMSKGVPVRVNHYIPINFKLTN